MTLIRNKIIVLLIQEFNFAASQICIHIELCDTLYGLIDPFVAMKQFRQEISSLFVQIVDIQTEKAKDQQNG